MHTNKNFVQFVSSLKDAIRERAVLLLTFDSLRRWLVLSTFANCALLLTSCGSGGISSPAIPGADDNSPKGVVTSPTVPPLERLVTEFGALPDDSLDDTAAIQAGLDTLHAAGGGTLVFPPGRYDISINPSQLRALTTYPKIRLLGRPAGQATLRLADKQVVYESILATASYPTRLDDAEFVDLNFDANGLNNPVLNPAETNGELGTPSLRYVIRSYAGHRVRVSGCTFVNLDDGNALTFNGAEVSDVLIEHNRFINVGGASIDHDHSTVYTDGRRIRIHGNEFRSRYGAGTLGARTAIETHGDDQEATENNVFGYLQGANVVAVASTMARQRYEKNAFREVAVGINIWPLGGAMATSGTAAFEHLVLTENEIQIDADAWWSSPAMVIVAPSGIHFEAEAATARITRLDILSNSIRFNTFSAHAPNRDAFSAGIELRGVAGRLAIDQLALSNNFIRDSIGPGISGSTTIGSTSASVISGNSLIDSGQGFKLIGSDVTQRSGIVLSGVDRNLSIFGNEISSSAGLSGPTLNGVALMSVCLEDCTVGVNSVTNISSALQILGTGWINLAP